MSTHTKSVSSPTPRIPEPLLTVADAARYLTVSRRQIYLLVERGDLPYVRVGERIRFIPAELRGYLKRNHEERSP
jgi:excisionase family DNA binding protein